ncbi:MAG: glycosyltransferase [Candidatus Aenigmatarchaeota archaeon]
MDLKNIEKTIILSEVKNPKISVIIPTLNEEKYLENTLLSLKYQNFKYPYEIIVSDGKSKDKTIQIAKKYVNKIVICKKRGIGLGRNCGALVSKGKYLVFLDADTMLLPNALSEIYKEIKKKDVALVTFPIVFYKADLVNLFYSLVYDSFVSLTSKTKNPQIAGMLMAVKRNHFFKIGGFNEDLKILEDYDLSKRIAKFGKVSIVTNSIAITSSRRIDKWGKLKSAIVYPSLYLSYLITQKDIGSKIYKPIR